MTTQERVNWSMRGYADAQERDPYKRAPAHSRGEYGGPNMPDEVMPGDWARYMDGWNAGIRDKAANTMRKGMLA